MLVKLGSNRSMDAAAYEIDLSVTNPARCSAHFNAGRRDSWMSSLDRGPEVSDAVRCDDDIGAVRRERPAAEIPDECRCSLPS